jgi:hypothetical protein
MNNLTKTLLCGAALSVLTAIPATAQHKHPSFSFRAFHAGRVVNKTKLRNPGAMHLTYTFGVYDYIQAQLNTKVWLGGSKWNSYSTICSAPKTKVKFAAKKTQYGKINAATQTYSLGCSSGPTTFYGVDYKLKDPAGKGKIDLFRYSVIGTFKNANGKYKGTLNADVSLTLE